MKVAVWDTYVVRTDKKKMHFDIVVPKDEKYADKIYQFGQEYLNGKRVLSEKVTSEECQFCHIEHASDKMIKDITEKGYHIIEMENCD